MLALRSPGETYRRIYLDARVEASEPRQLVAICYERLDEALSAALYAHDTHDSTARSRAITRALSAITALLLGVEGDEGVAAPLRQFYGAARQALLDAALAFDPAIIAAMRRDFAEIAAATSSF
ncbi:MAG: flagellar protein FliS [Novosphingobium sp.]